jgi:hypothetical protein
MLYVAIRRIIISALSNVFQHSTPTLSRSDISRFGPHTPTAATTTIMGTSPHYTSGQISLEDPWLRDLSRQYTSTQAISPQAIPRISARSAKSHIRKSDSAEQPRRFVDEAMRRQRSYPTLSSFAPTVGQLHTSPGVDSSTEFTRVKHEPDGDSSIPPLRLGWAYETHSPPSPNLSVSFFSGLSPWIDGAYIGGMTAPGEQVNIMGALRETFQTHLYSATCTDRRETIQLLFLMELAAGLRVVALLSN